MDIRRLLGKSKERVSDFSTNTPWRKIFTYLFFFVLAFIFWLMLFFRRDVEGTYKIPIKYTNIPEDVVFNEPLPEFIEVRIADKGLELFKMDIRRRDSLLIDIRTAKAEYDNILQGNQYIQVLRSRLAPSTQLRGYSPASISLVTSKLQSKELSVEFDGELATNRSNLMVDTMEFIPQTVKAYGSKASLDTLSKALTDYSILNNLRSTSQVKVPLKEIEGVKFVPDEVELYVTVLEYTERSFDVPIQSRHVPNDIDVKFFPSKVKVSFSATLEDYKKITEDDFSIQIDYNALRQSSDGKVEIVLTSQPSSIVNVRLVPSSVEFLIENR